MGSLADCFTALSPPWRASFGADADSAVPEFASGPAKTAAEDAARKSRREMVDGGSWRIRDDNELMVFAEQALRVADSDRVSLLLAQWRLFELEERGFKVEQRRVRAEEDALGRHLREEFCDASHAFEHG